MKDFDWSQGQEGEAREKVRILIMILASGVFPHEDFGDDIEKIIQRFRERSQELMPPGSEDLNSFRDMIATGGGLIATIPEQVASDALYNGDYHKALEVGNHVYFFGELAYQDQLNILIFLNSVSFHREFANRLREKFGDQDLYLKVTGPIAFRVMEEARETKNFHRELQIARGTIHSVALNGTLGRDAKRAVDPLAIVSQFRV